MGARREGLDVTGAVDKIKKKKPLSMPIHNRSPEQGLQPSGNAVGRGRRCGHGPTGDRDPAAEVRRCRTCLVWGPTGITETLPGNLDPGSLVWVSFFGDVLFPEAPFLRQEVTMRAARLDCGGQRLSAGGRPLLRALPTSVHILLWQVLASGWIECALSRERRRFLRQISGAKGSKRSGLACAVCGGPVHRLPVVHAGDRL